MTATILTFPDRPIRKKRAAVPERGGAVISLDAHRCAARLRRTMTGVYFITPAQPSPGDSTAA